MKGAAMSEMQQGAWTKPAAMAIPKEGYFELQQGKYGPVYPKTPACYGFTIIAKIKPANKMSSGATERRLRERSKTPPICLHR